MDEPVRILDDADPNMKLVVQYEEALTALARQVAELWDAVSTRRAELYSRQRGLAALSESNLQAALTRVEKAHRDVEAGLWALEGMELQSARERER